jgi:hypothetical protein
VVAVCVVIVFLSGTGTAPTPVAATTVPISTTFPWVDRTTPGADDLEPSVLEQRVAALQPWLEETRGLRAPYPPAVRLLDADGRDAWEAARRDAAVIEWPDYELVYPFFGRLGPDEWWPVWTYASGTIVVEAELTELAPSQTLVERMVPELTNWGYSHTQAMAVLLYRGMIGDEFDALRTLVIGDGMFTGAGYNFYLSTGREWVPAEGGCLPPRTRAFRSWWSAGEDYVCRLYEEGGWARVNQAYEDPPESTAEILGIACDVLDAPMTPMPDWPVLFEAPRGPLWFSMMVGGDVGGDISRIGGWCADHQRVVGTALSRIMVMEIWLGTEVDARIVEEETLEFFAAAEDIESLVVRDGSWVGIASTLSTLDLCSQLPGWCP